MRKQVFCGGLLLFLLLTGCGGPAANGNAPVDFVGNHPTEGYVPETASVQAVPYSYQGRGEVFSVTCTVRTLTEAERDFKVRLKAESLAQLEGAKVRFPQQADRYLPLMEKLRAEIEVLEQADVLYVTEVMGVCSDENAAALRGEAVSYTITAGARTVLSSCSAVTAVPWLSILNTADGAYSEGVLLPLRDSCAVTVTCGGMTETFPLERQN